MMGFKGVNGMVMAEASTVSTRLLHPKMKILSSFTHQLFQTCMSFFLLLNTKEDILKKFGTKQLFGTIDLHSRKKMEVNGANRSSKDLSLVFSRRKKLIQGCNNLRVSK